MTPPFISIAQKNNGGASPLDDPAAPPSSDKSASPEKGARSRSDGSPGLKPATRSLSARETIIDAMWFNGVHAEIIAMEVTRRLNLPNPMSSGQVYVIAHRMGLPRRVKTASGQLMPIIRQEAGEAALRHPASPKKEGYRLCIRCGCGRRFWSKGAGDRLCSYHRAKNE